MQGPPLDACGGEVLRDSKTSRMHPSILQGANMVSGSEALWLAHCRPRERPLVRLHRASPMASIKNEAAALWNAVFIVVFHTQPAVDNHLYIPRTTYLLHHAR